MHGKLKAKRERWDGTNKPATSSLGAGAVRLRYGAHLRWVPRPLYSAIGFWIRAVEQQQDKLSWLEIYSTVPTST